MTDAPATGYIGGPRGARAMNRVVVGAEHNLSIEERHYILSCASRAAAPLFDAPALPLWVGGAARAPFSALCAIRRRVRLADRRKGRAVTEDADAV